MVLANHSESFIAHCKPPAATSFSPAAVSAQDVRTHAPSRATVRTCVPLYLLRLTVQFQHTTLNTSLPCLPWVIVGARPGSGECSLLFPLPFLARCCCCPFLLPDCHLHLLCCELLIALDCPRLYGFPAQASCTHTVDDVKVIP